MQLTLRVYLLFYFEYIYALLYSFLLAEIWVQATSCRKTLSDIDCRTSSLTWGNTDSYREYLK